MKAHTSGKIVTFYSYKGGTGRSMALANVAWILASQGKRVLMVDWDLEAPGLHRYFHPFLQDKNLTASEGIIDLVTRFEDAAIRPSMDPTGMAQEKDPKWYVPLARFESFTLPLAWSFDGKGELDLLPAGKQGPSYAARVNSFNWSTFYDRLGGGVFLEAVKVNMRRLYDYILIDSRTGVSDTAGICSVQFPDILVICFTLNIQSIEGAAAVAGSVKAQRTDAANLGDRVVPLRIFPVPMRVELNGAKERLEQARYFARRSFDGFLDHLSEQRRDKYWGSIEVPYDSFYAYEEMLATVADTPGVTNSVLSSLERLTDFLSDGDIVAQARLGEEERQSLKQLYLQGIQRRSIRSVLASKPELQEFCDIVTTRQKAWSESEGNSDYLLDFTLVNKLSETVELLAVLLEDKDFRDFWTASQAGIRRSQKRAFLSVHLYVAILFIILFVVIWPERISLSAELPVELLLLASAGILGTVASLVRETLAGKYSPANEFPFKAGRYVIALVNGAIFGIATNLLIKPYVSLNSEWTEYFIAFIGGILSRDFFRTLAERLVMVVEKK